MVPSINFDQMGKEEKIIGGCFQTTKRKVKHFFFQISWHLRPSIFSCQLDVFGIMTVFNLFQDCFRVTYTICESLIFADGDNLRFVGKRIMSFSVWLTVSSVKHQPEGGCSTGRTERNEGMKEWRKEGRKEGRKEIFWIFIISFFHYLYSSTQRRYRADRR